MIGVIPGQMALDLFPEPSRPDAAESCISRLVSMGCDEERVAPMVRELFGRFGAPEARDRANCLAYFYGARPIPRLRSCPPSAIGLFDGSIDYHVVWDRCWAARWAPLRDVFEVREWRYNYRRPYTGAPVFIWYVDNKGREVKRPYEEGACEG
ncbi:hypothetical protein COLINT_02325 [Collinsella intestinalis DSM 13280]|uniref:Uncharacterized protein n=1 Tax=Collinsella intestinalis DSM 13280 TaxID=521003 RepID=C4F8F4_9ACTN|nr:hypothetical protein [Collinsella intestinalis]EEP44826.1 hypothetical protein COLINT_02325 [Collinsella intestinalis DSM 13280]